MATELSDMALRQIHGDRIVKRQIDELIGLAKGALLDGRVEQREAEGIYAWLDTNVMCLDTWPANVLYERLRSMLADGVLDADESAELLGLLMQFAAPQGDVSALRPRACRCRCRRRRSCTPGGGSALPACSSSGHVPTATKRWWRAAASR